MLNKQYCIHLFVALIFVKSSYFKVCLFFLYIFNVLKFLFKFFFSVDIYMNVA